MRLAGRLVRNNKTLRQASVDISDDNKTFRDLLEECLITLCRELDIQVPLWLNKNTTEFINFRKTFFSPEQFMDGTGFDRFEVRLY